MAMRMACWSMCLLAALASARFAAGQDAESKSPAEKQYEDRAAKLGEKDAKGWLALADWCETQRLFAKSEGSAAEGPDDQPGERRGPQATG